MTINEFLSMGLVGCYEPIKLFDIREDGYMFDHSAPAYEIASYSLYKDLDVLRISAGSDDDGSFLILDVDKYQISISELMSQINQGGENNGKEKEN